ncbi:MAG: hypothetical protein LBO74_01490 [Candidatus Symbiothrix sp.]|jgi:hypothetical protein|nr:hypothetical protein [Candidatus Symbiothrix sp.]
MKIFVYWNYKDSDSKKIYGFLDEYITLLKTHHQYDVSFYKKCKHFDMNGVMETDIAESDMILMFTHGEKDRILKYLYPEPSLLSSATLVNKSNAQLFMNKIVVAMCCDSAVELGEFCNNPESPISTTYIGFRDAIQYDTQNNGVRINETFRATMYKSYSEAFQEAFTFSIDNNCTAAMFVRRLKLNLRSFATKNILEGKNRSFGSASPAQMYTRTANSLVVLGNSNIQLF